MSEATVEKAEEQANEAIAALVRDAFGAGGPAVRFEVPTPADPPGEPTLFVFPRASGEVLDWDDQGTPSETGVVELSYVVTYWDTNVALYPESWHDAQSAPRKALATVVKAVTAAGDSPAWGGGGGGRAAGRPRWGGGGCGPAGAGRGRRAARRGER
ncbi:hypothetical protein ACFXD5_23665, partial [Streptomyces sp. NPDC059385]|uniref:hypothetical protein n=1 Tax=Streptomyces sp. NPDC059385 TaxID=3346817 RepID=UPI0036A144D5